jgi:hypothetical protein
VLERIDPGVEGDHDGGQGEGQRQGRHEEAARHQKMK